MASLVATLKDKLTGGTSTLDAARRAVEKAESDLATEDRRIVLAKIELDSASDAIAAADPDDDAKVFAKLVQTRDAARGKLEALGVRRDRAEQTLIDARAARRVAELSAQRAELEQIALAIRDEEAGLLRAASELASEITEGQAALGKMYTQAERLDAELRAVLGDALPRIVKRGRARWLDSGRPLEVAARILGAKQ